MGIYTGENVDNLNDVIVVVAKQKVLRSIPQDLIYIVYLIMPQALIQNTRCL